MADREKVVKALKCCSEGNCLNCPFVKDHMEPHVIGCENRLMKYALELLKDQEPISDSCHYVYKCGNCLEIITGTHFNYCPNCGKKVKWE